MGGGCRGVITISDWLKSKMEKESVAKKDEITRLNHLGNEGKMEQRLPVILGNQLPKIETRQS